MIIKYGIPYVDLWKEYHINKETSQMEFHSNDPNPVSTSRSPRSPNLSDPPPSGAEVTVSQAWDVGNRFPTATDHWSRDKWLSFNGKP